ncbi:MAG: hypothetical protein H0T21_00090, partial [Gemmatimonadaceae bacterium]|nr:hypothetical protein [Gemmatimonadaceae bacterium]
MSKIREDSARDLGVIEAGLRQPTSRRGFVRMLGAVALPGVLMSCDDDDDGIVGPGEPVTGVSFDLRSDAGFLRLVQVLEEVEAFFYTAVVANSNFNSFFPAEERELFV